MVPSAEYHIKSRWGFGAGFLRAVTFFLPINRWYENKAENCLFLLAELWLAGCVFVLFYTLCLSPPRITVTPDGTLWIYNISRADEGKYTCFAENYLGKANSTGHLSVRGKLWLHVSVEPNTAFSALWPSPCCLLKFIQFVCHRSNVAHYHWWNGRDGLNSASIYRAVVQVLCEL